MVLAHRARPITLGLKSSPQASPELLFPPWDPSPYPRLRHPGNRHPARTHDGPFGITQPSEFASGPVRTPERLIRLPSRASIPPSFPPTFRFIPKGSGAGLETTDANQPVDSVASSDIFEVPDLETPPYVGPRDFSPPRLTGGHHTTVPSSDLPDSIHLIREFPSLPPY